METFRSFRITGKAIILALIAFFLFFAATNIRSGWLYMVDAVLASLLLYSAGVVWRSSASLRVTRRALAIAEQGEDVPITLRIENTDRRAFLCLKLTDVLPAKGLTDAAAQAIMHERFFLRLRGQDNREFTYYLPCRFRGRYNFSSYRVTLYGPLGLFSRTRTYPLASEVLVYPRLPDLGDYSSLGTDQRQHRSGDIPQPFLIGRAGMLPKGVRDYRTGDSRRLVDWRSTARMNKLMVKDMEVETGLAYNLFLDTTPVLPQQDEPFETAIKLVGAVAMYGLKHGHVCQILVPRHEPVVSAPRLLDFLARLEADSQDSLPARLAELADGLGPRATVVLALQRLNVAALEGLKRLQYQDIEFTLYICGPVEPEAQAWCEREGIAWQQAEQLLRGHRPEAAMVP